MPPYAMYKPYNFKFALGMKRHHVNPRIDMNPSLASAVPPLRNANNAACHSNLRRHRRQQTNQRRSLVTSLMPAGGEVAATNAWIRRRLKKGNLLCLRRLCPPTIVNHARLILVSRKQTSMANQKTNIDASEEWRDAVVPAQGQRLSSILCSSLNRRQVKGSGEY
nr:hypothetical protein Iba_chr13aCG9330 [Ipomoea batatas]